MVSIASFGLVQAGTDDILSGFAWSENIGWISFNSTSDGSSQDYGVTFNASSGVLTGSAWSENIGWISFNDSEVSSPPFSPYQSDSFVAISDKDTGVFTGWGRALTACLDDNWSVNQCIGSDAGDQAGGWDGWISLSGSDPAYGVTRDLEDNTVSGYAWGGDVIGWISFSGSDPDYGVVFYGADGSNPVSQITDPANGSWFFDDFTMNIVDEDFGFGLDYDECTYEIYNFDGASYVGSGLKSRDCNDPVDITVALGSEPNGCGIEGRESCGIYVWSTDLSGLDSEAGIKFYSIDFTAPEPGELYLIDPDEEKPIQVEAGEFYTLKSVVKDNLQVSSCNLYISGSKQSDTVTLASGSTERIASVVYQFPSSGTYHNNYMKCQDAAGNISTSEPITFFTVTPAESPFISSMTAYSSHTEDPNIECASQYSCCMDYTTQDDCLVKFNITASAPGDPEGENLTYDWTFGDGGTSTDKNPSHHYSSASTGNGWSATVTASNETDSGLKSMDVVVVTPSLTVDLSAIPSFGLAPLSGVDLRDIVSGTMFGKIDYNFNCGNGTTANVTATTTNDYTATSICNYTEGDYTATTTVARGTGGASDSIDISATGDCTYNAESNATTTCNSDQGCSHVIECRTDNTWPSCSTDECTIGDVDGGRTCSDTCEWSDGDCTSDFDCYCPLDGCLDSYYYDYPVYGSCTNYSCEIGTQEEGSCYVEKPAEPDSRCNIAPICNSLTATPSSGVSPLSVLLTADVVDNDGPGDISYIFDFGDLQGATPGTNNVTHLYYVLKDATSTTYIAEISAEDEYNAVSTINATTTITVTRNIPPVAALGCSVGSCGVDSLCDIAGTSILYHQNCIFSFINESTDDDSSNPPDNNDHIVKSTWSIFYNDDSSYSSNSYTGSSTMDNFTVSGLAQRTAYYVLLEVEDAKGGTSTTSADFYVRKEIVAGFECSLDPGEEKVWKDCANLSVSEGETVYLQDVSEGSDIDESATEATITGWNWTFTGGTPLSSTQQDPTASFEQGVANTGRIELTVTDSAGRSDDTSHDLIITIPLPEWQEIPPL
ncbi:MAG: PKD domain-containing protein [Candidatus Heimdallarchaeaceae archaeon]